MRKRIDRIFSVVPSATKKTRSDNVTGAAMAVGEDDNFGENGRAGAET